MGQAHTHNGSSGNGAAKPPRPATTIVRHHRGQSEDEALERFRAAVAKQQKDGLYPIALSWMNGHDGAAADDVELAVTYLRRDS